MTSGGISTLQSHNMELSGTSTVLKQNTWNTHRGHMMREHITAGALWDTSCYVISIEVRGDVDGSSEVGGGLTGSGWEGAGTHVLFPLVRGQEVNHRK